MLVLLLSLAHADPWALSGELGGELNSDSHGIANVTARRGDTSVAWITDTLDVRYAPEHNDGRAWVAGRLATFAAGMVISPWEDGELQPDQAMNGLYGGVEAGGIRYAAHGLYAGARGHVRWHTFYGGADADRPVGRWHLQPQGITGWWSEWLHAWWVVGTDLQRSPEGEVASVSPHIRGQAELRPAWTVAPLLELRAGAGEGQDVVTLTRLGGLNPYVVPLAGAAWAEFWVEDYVAGRAGAVVQTEPVDVAVFVDAAAFQGPTGYGRALGIGAAPTWRAGRLTTDLAVGYAPVIEGPDDRVPFSVYVLVGWQ